MAQAPYDMGTAKKLLNAGHITPAQYGQIHKMCYGGVTKMADGGVVGDDSGDFAGIDAVPTTSAPAPVNIPVQYDATKDLPQPVVTPQNDAQPAVMQNYMPPAGDVPVIQPEQHGATGSWDEPSLVKTGYDVEGQNLVPQQPQMTPQQNAFQSAFDKLNQSYEIEQQGVAGAAAAGAAKGAEEAAKINLMQKNDQVAIANQTALADKHAAKLQEVNDKLNTSLDSIASQKIDTNRFWNDKSTGDKVLAGIGLILGGFGSHGNQAVSVINNAINRDIEAQRADIENQKSSVSGKMNLYGRMMDQFHNEEAALAATRIASLNNAQLGLQATAAKYAGPEAAARAQQAYGQIERQKQGQWLQFQQAMLRTMPLDPSRVTNPQVQLTPEQQEKWVPGYGLALTKEGGKQLREGSADFKAVNGMLDQLNSINQQGAMAKLSPTASAQANTLVTNLGGTLRKEMFGGGIYNEAERNMMHDMIPDPTSMTTAPWKTEERIKQLKSIIQNKWQDKLQSEGLSTPQDRIGFTPIAKK